MEKLKDPAMILGGANTLGLIGVVVYFYKQVETINGDLGKISQAITGIVRKMADMEKTDQHKTEALRALNEEMKRILEQISDLPSFGEFNDINMDLTEIIATMEDNNMIVERPSQTSRTRRSGDRRNPRRATVDSEMDVRDTSKRSSVRTRDSTRDYERQPPRNVPRDDLDLIREVRHLQPSTRS